MCREEFFLVFRYLVLFWSVVLCFVGDWIKALRMLGVFDL